MEQGKSNEQRETRILDAAERLIIRYGYNKTTVSDIANEAGISKGAVYLHYSSKEALFEDLVLRTSEKVTANIIERLQQDPNGDTIGGFYSNSLMAIAANPLTKALYSNDRRVLGDFLRYLIASPHYQPLVTLGMDFVAQSQAAGLIRRDLSAKSITTILLALRYGFLMIDDVLPIAEQASLDELEHSLGVILQAGLNPDYTGDSKAHKQVYITILNQALAMFRDERRELKEKQS